MITRFNPVSFTSLKSEITELMKKEEDSEYKGQGTTLEKLLNRPDVLELSSKELDKVENTADDYSGGALQGSNPWADLINKYFSKTEIGLLVEDGRRKWEELTRDDDTKVQR